MYTKTHFYTIYTLLLASLFLLSSCGQLSSLQTGRVLEKGETTIGGAILGYGVQGENAGGGEIGAALFPQAEILVRRGLSSNFDMGLKISTGGNVLLDGKYQFVGNGDSPFAVAIGTGFELQVAEENTVLRTHFPLYLSYHFKEKNAVYTTPRYVFQYVKEGNNSYFIGLGGGYYRRFSPEISGLLEGSFYIPKTQNSNNKEVNIFQFGVGMSYHF